MLEFINKYRSYVIKSGFVILTGALLILIWQIILQGPEIISNITLFIGNFIDVIKPIIYAFILAYLLFIPVSFIERLIYKLFKGKVKHPKLVRLLSVFVVVLIVVALIVAIVSYLVPLFVDNIKLFISTIPNFEDQLGIWYKELSQYLQSMNISQVELEMFVKEILGPLQSISQNILNGLGTMVGSVSGAILNAVVTIILMFYFLIDKERVINSINKLATILFPSKVYKVVKKFINDLDAIVGKYIAGSIICSVIVGVVSTALMLIIKHPFAIIIGVAAGITNIIPYVGPVLGAGLAFILGIFTSFQLGIIAAVLLLLYQQVDGNFIQPKIVGDQVGVAPVWILVAVLIGGSYFGGIGMIISVPIAGLCGIYIDRLYKYKQKKKGVITQ